MKGRWPIIAMVAGVIVVAVLWISRHRNEGTDARHNGKTAAEWFYGNRTNFFAESQTKAAEGAFKAMGTNGLPFLLSQLERRESGLNAIYFKVYARLPRLIQTKLPYPLSRSDVQWFALNHVGKLGPLPAPWIERLTACVMAINDDQIRHHGMRTVAGLPGSLESKPHVTGMLNKLLYDRHFLLCLDAALELMRRDCITTNVFPVLHQCISDYQLVSGSLANAGYRFGQPPNSTNRAAGINALLIGKKYRLLDQPTLRQTESLRALLLIEPSLDQPSREKLWLTFGDLPLRTPPERRDDRVGLYPDDVEKTMGMRMHEGIRLLTSLLNDPAPSGRARAAKALRWFGQRASEAMPALKKALDDPSDEVRSAAQAALKAVTRDVPGETGDGSR